MDGEPANDEGLKAKIALLRQEHRDLDEAIEALVTGPNPDMFQVARLKKRKLALRDEIIRLSEQITPDIIA